MNHAHRLTRPCATTPGLFSYSIITRLFVSPIDFLLSSVIIYGYQQFNISDFNPVPEISLAHSLEEHRMTTTIRPSIFTSPRFWCGAFIVAVGTLCLCNTFLSVQTKEERTTELFFGWLIVFIGFVVAFKRFISIALITLGVLCLWATLFLGGETGPRIMMGVVGLVAIGVGKTMFSIDSSE